MNIFKDRGYWYVASRDHLGQVFGPYSTPPKIDDKVILEIHLWLRLRFGSGEVLDVCISRRHVFIYDYSGTF